MHLPVTRIARKLTTDQLAARFQKNDLKIERRSRHRCNRSTKHFDLGRQRWRDLSSLAMYRYAFGKYDFMLPETDEARTLALQMMAHLHLDHDERVRFCRDHVSWLDPREIDPTDLYCLAAATLGEKLRLSAAERMSLGITTIRVCVAEKKQAAAIRKARKQERDRERARLKRRTAGAKPREQYLASTLSRSQPWKGEGISRSKWYRKRP